MHSRILGILLVCLSLMTRISALAAPPAIRTEAAAFLDLYEKLMAPIYTQSSEAEWAASTDVTDLHVGERIGAEKVAATFFGNSYVIETAQRLLKNRSRLTSLQVLQLESILRSAADYPATIPLVVRDRVEAEAKQSATLDGYEFCMKRKGAACEKKTTPNEIDRGLRTEKDVGRRLALWTASKEVGTVLKPGLTHLRDLRNRTSREMGYSSYFAYQVEDYGMKTNEMMALLRGAVEENRPLYEQLHCWTKRKLADRYGQPVPKRIPAHWLPNRWGQEWSGLTESINMDPFFAKRSPEWIVKTAENFYVSLGFPVLPKSFWERSDLYSLAGDAKRKKNTHASAWHVDLFDDVRSLMSVEPDWGWFGTTHHELGHVYYFLSYSRPEIPVVLREGANRAFHEALGDVIFMASTSPTYVKKLGIVPADWKVDSVQWLLNQALEDAPIFLPWSAGVMSEFEHDLYERALPQEQFNSRWWKLVGNLQGIDPPAPRPEETCDACTKTHINDDPAQYYDYALAFLLKYQLHAHICGKIVGADVHDCDFSGNVAVGKFLGEIMRLGKTRDWRKVVQEATGEPLSGKAMAAYFEPLRTFLSRENGTNDCRY